MSDSIRLVFVDDHGLCRKTLSELVERRAGMRVLAIVGKPDEARLNDPDLPVIDLRKDKTDGLSLVCRLADDVANPLRLLTDRERHVLDHVVRGMSNKEIAKALAISHDTVKLHVRHILAKLNLTSRVEAAVFAVEQKMMADGAEGMEPTFAHLSHHGS